MGCLCASAAAGEKMGISTAGGKGRRKHFRSIPKGWFGVRGAGISGPCRCVEDKNPERGAYFRSGVVGVSHDISAPSLGDSVDCEAEMYFRSHKGGESQGIR